MKKQGMVCSFLAANIMALCSNFVGLAAPPGSLKDIELIPIRRKLPLELAPEILTKEPNLLKTFDWMVHEKSSFWCAFDFDSKGLGGESVPAGAIMAGYFHAWDPGAAIMGCSEKLTHVYRGGVRFDLAEVKDKPIIKATLSYRRAHTSAATSTGGEGFSISDTCAGRLLQATEDLVAASADGLPKGEDIVPLSKEGPFSVDVTDIVKLWSVLPVKNFGFLFVGQDESSPRDNNQCWSQYDQLKLTVEIKR